MLYVIGLGLGDERDVTMNGLAAIQKCAKVYLEAYTSILGVNVDKLSTLYGKEVTVCDGCDLGMDGIAGPFCLWVKEKAPR